ncbi:type I-E CRISPR-associated protein Cse1/CasA [Streptomyces sp. 7N604]|uniref:type I-E CRISPR-associated protein Cse1/CasA n=1 Tax=Streptomyces sp. 7N604 TaxID=3457415 RepID=UPI003FD1D488
MPSYDLLEQPSLMLRPRGGGDIVEVGWAEALLRADEFESLVVDLPTQVPALLRHALLPIVLDALGSPVDLHEWSRRFTEGRFTQPERERLLAYCEEHRDRFDLFGADAPFAQVADLRTAKVETKGSALLVATAATGNNVPLFASRTEGDPLPLSPAQAVRWLLHTHCWDTAAIKTGAVGDPKVKAGKTTGNPTGPLGQLGLIVPEGRTLYETLLLNLPIGKQGLAGTPQWRRAPAEAAWQTRAPDGLLDLWTWQSRRIRLIPEQTPDGLRVTRIVLCAGDRLEALPEWETHTAWKFTKSKKSRIGAERSPRRHQPGKAIWRGLDALLASEYQPGSGDGWETSSLLLQLAELQEHQAVSDEYPLRLQTFGMSYGTQSAVIEDVLHDAIPLPVTALRTDGLAYAVLLEVAQQAEDLATAINNLSADLRRASGADPIPWDKGQRPGEFVLHLLDPLVRQLLTKVRAAGEDDDLLNRGQVVWEQRAWLLAREVSEPLFAAAPASVFSGRTAMRNNRPVTYSLGTAESNFRRRLAQILPRATEPATERRSDRAAAVLSNPGA